METIDRVDEILNSLKAFNTYLNQIIEKGYDNDINDLEYLHEIVDTFYSSSNNEKNTSENNILEYYNDTTESENSDSDLDNISISSDNIETIEENNDLIKKVSDDFINNFYSNNISFENILIFNKNKNHKYIFNDRLKNYFIY
jgi:hypothetical protein